MEAESLTTGAIFGAIVWEAGKQLLTNRINKIDKNIEKRNELIRNDVDAISQLICEIQEAAISYFRTNSNTDDAKELSTQIRKKLKTASIRISSLNKQVKDSESENKINRIWITFRASCTFHLDVQRDDIWDEEDPRINAIYKSANQLYSNLHTLRYSTVQ